MRRALATIAAVVAGLTSAPAWAEAPHHCDAATAPWILLRTEAADAENSAHVIEQLRASLLPRGVDVCSSDDDARGAAIAAVEVSSLGRATVQTTIIVRDQLTDKRVERDLDLSAIPQDGRALTVALALDELLRASWAELMLVSAHRTSIPIPKAVTDTVAADVAPAAQTAVRARDWEIGGGLAAEHFGDGHDQFGVDAEGPYWPSPRLGFHAKIGGRGGLVVHATDGSVSSSALVGAVGGNVALTPRQSRARLELVAELWGAHVNFSGDGQGSRAAESGDAVYAIASAKAGYAWRPSLRTFVSVGLGAPLRTLHATDAGSRVTGLGGVLVSGAAGVSWVF